MTYLNYSARFTPKRLSVTQQPNGAVAGVPLTTQPIVQILDGGGELCRSATNSVVATKHSGVAGTLSGDTDKDAVAGVATFTDLQMSAAETGVTIDFGSSGLTGAQSSAFSVSSGGGASPFFSMVANDQANYSALAANYDATSGTASLVTGQTGGSGASGIKVLRFSTPGDGSGANISQWLIKSINTSTLYVERWVRFNSALWPGTYSGFQEHKFMLAYQSGDRTNLELYNNTTNYVWGYPGDQIADVSAMPAAVARNSGDGAWHLWQFAMKTGAGSFQRYAIDGVEISDLADHGMPSSISGGAYVEVMIGYRPLNNSPSNVVTFDVEWEKFYNADPGWSWL